MTEKNLTVQCAVEGCKNTSKTQEFVFKGGYAICVPCDKKQHEQTSIVNHHVQELEKLGYRFQQGQ